MTYSSLSKDNQSLLSSESVKTYRRLLAGDIKSFPPVFFSPHVRKKRIQQLLTYLIEYILCITPEEAYETLDFPTLKENHLEALMRYVEDFPEKNEKRSIRYLLRIAYPHLPEESFEEMVLSVYKEVLEGKRKSFPSNYFYGVQGEKRVIVCIRYLCEEILHLQEEEIPRIITRELLTKYKLKILLNLFYNSPFDVITTAYPHLTTKNFE
ncbi:DUF4046 domain-containing protein [Neobacillus sp. YIM B02564]|uniref:DUF4046 domain-containing protein n=1 Tax=Neobacillus paridis TaxID=2803862 RepID=A0ABS1TLI7_9BACI|nr:DUF4046 domain-containing protein [Neobacillus paridis]MBL4952107.1 DUF4046 domain-containing protein [Neobacillus paridis]